MGWYTFLEVIGRLTHGLRNLFRYVINFVGNKFKEKDRSLDTCHILEILMKSARVTSKETLTFSCQIDGSTGTGKIFRFPEI